MSRKTFVLDANVLLHDPETIKQFHDNDVLIPLIALEKLDTMKRLPSELGKNPRLFGIRTDIS
jgi:PhoH-like ATPase